MIYQLPIEIVGIICFNLVSLIIQRRYILCIEGLHRLGCAAMFDCVASFNGSLASWNIPY